MSEPRNNNLRALPKGSQTREELKALVSKHGSVAESEVLAHINRDCAQNPWNHANFVSFFVESGQTVFVVRNGRLFLAANEEDSSDEAPFGVSNVPVLRPRFRHDNIVDGGGQNKSLNLDVEEDLDMDESSDAEQLRIRREELPALMRVNPDSSPTGDQNRRGDAVRPKSSASPRPTSVTSPPPGFSSYQKVAYDTDEDIQPDRLHTKEDVLQLVGANRRYYRRNIDAEKMVTMDPNPAYKKPPVLRLKFGDDTSDDTEEEAEEEEQASRTPDDPRLQAREEKTNALRNGEVRSANTNNESTVKRKAAPRAPQESDAQRPLFWDAFFEAKEQMDFKDSRERDPEKVYKDLMRFGRVSKSDAEMYYEYFRLLQNFNIDCLSNSQLVAGTLALIEADTKREKLIQIREKFESQQ